MPKVPRWLVSITLAAILLAGLLFAAVSAQVPEPPWLLRIPCASDPQLTRLLARGLRVVLWQEGYAYALATADTWQDLVGEGLAVEILDREPPLGDYFVVAATPAEAEALRRRYGCLAALGDGFYLLGLPPDAPPEAPAGVRFARRLPERLQTPPPPLAAPATSSSASTIDALVSLVSADRLRRDIAELQDDDSHPGPDALRSRFSMVSSLDVEGAYIARELAAAGLTIAYHPVLVTDRYVGASRVVSNIVGTLAGLKPESEGFYIVCAHYDSTGANDHDMWPTQWRTWPAPGADDNASGTAVVLELFDKPEPGFTPADRQVVTGAAQIGADLLRQAIAERQTHQLLFDAIEAALRATAGVTEVLASPTDAPPPAVLEQLKVGLAQDVNAVADPETTLELVEAVRGLAPVLGANNDRVRLAMPFLIEWK